MRTRSMGDRQGMAWAMGVLAGVVALAGVAGCKRSDPVPTAQPALAPEATAASSAGAVTLSPATTTSAEAPSARAESTAPANTTAVDAVPRFFLVAETAVEHFITGKSGGLLIRFTQENYKGISTSLEIVDDRIVKVPNALDGIAEFFGSLGLNGQLDSFGGSWPNAAFAAIKIWGIRGSSMGRLFRWDGQKWIAWANFGSGIRSETMAATSHKGMLIAAGAVHDYGGNSEMSIRSLDGKTFTPLPGKGFLGKGVAECRTRMVEVWGLEAAPSGDLFALGEDCSNDLDLAVERFNGGGTSTGFFALPQLTGTDVYTSVNLAALNASEVYVARATRDRSKSVFVRLDGASWKPVAGAPFQQAITSLGAGSDGSLWAVSDGAVFRRLSSGAWVKAEMPVGARAESIAVTDGDVWAFGSLGEQPAVFRTRPMRYAVKLDAAPKAESADKPVPSTPACKTPFVLLYKVAENAAPSYDFPKTREAVAGHTELAGMSLVVTDRGYFGATVPTHEVGEKLVDVVKGKVKGAKPQVVCMTPKIQEEIPIDLTTGKVKRP